jgi:hypothetical protein
MFSGKDAENQLTMISRLELFISLRGILNTISMSRKKKKGIDATYFEKKTHLLHKISPDKKITANLLCRNRSRKLPTAMSRKMVKNFYDNRAA